MVKKQPAAAAPRQIRQPPEMKIGPFAGGIGVAIWTNTTESDDGPRQYRTITIAPRRYQDKKTGEWKDAGGFAPSDLPALIFALQKAQEYVFTRPLHEHESADNSQSDERPF